MNLILEEIIKKEKKENNLINNVEIIEKIMKTSWISLENYLGFRIKRKDYLDLQKECLFYFLEEGWKEILSKSDLSEARGRIQNINSQPTIEDIRRAIKNRYYGAIYYKDDEGNEGFRLVEPYVLGKGYVSGGKLSKGHENHYYIRVFVIKDASRDKSVKFKRNKSVSISENTPYWRLMRVDRILSWVTIPRRFSWYRELYTGGTDKNMYQNIENIPISAFKGKNTEING